MIPVDRCRLLRLVLLVLLLPSAATAAGSGRSLSILLTNDDGWDSPGIHALADALRAAGHRLTIVAPLGQRSGSGMKMTLGELDLVEQAAGVWSVDASPADAVSLGLRHLMRDNPPDLVVSGANFGQNLGHNVFISGTVGAALTAVIAGVPALAVSVGINLDEGAGEPPYASTLAAFPRAAALTTAVVEELSRHDGGPVLPAGVALNLNVPAVPDGRLRGLRWTPVSGHGGFRVIYPRIEAGRVKSWIEPDPDGIADGETDTAMFAAGFVTLSALRPDLGSDAAALPVLRERLGALALP